MPVKAFCEGLISRGFSRPETTEIEYMNHGTPYQQGMQPFWTEREQYLCKLVTEAYQDAGLNHADWTAKLPVDYLDRLTSDGETLLRGAVEEYARITTTRNQQKFIQDCIARGRLGSLTDPMLIGLASHMGQRFAKRGRDPMPQTAINAPVYAGVSQPATSPVTAPATPDMAKVRGALHTLKSGDVVTAIFLLEEVCA